MHSVINFQLICIYSSCVIYAKNFPPKQLFSLSLCLSVCLSLRLPVCPIVSWLKRMKISVLLFCLASCLAAYISRHCKYNVSSECFVFVRVQAICSIYINKAYIGGMCGPQKTHRLRLPHSLRNWQSIKSALN